MLLPKAIKQQTRLSQETYHQLRSQSTIQSQNTFVLDNLLEAVDTVLVQKLSDNLGALVLHTSLDQIDGVYDSGTDSATDRTEQESVCA